MLCTQYCRILAVSNAVSLFFAVNAVISAHERCTVALYQPKGLINSPNRTQLQEIFIHESLESNLTCRWIIYPQPGIIRLKFTKFRMGIKAASNECSDTFSLKIIDRSAISFGLSNELQLCGSKPPPAYYSKGPMLELQLIGNLLHPSFDDNSFEAWYTTVITVPTVPEKCGPCGGTLNRETGMIRSPKYPKQYPNNCDCKWEIMVRKGYVIEFRFWAFSLEPADGGICHDFLSIYDGSSGSSKLLGKYCGNTKPANIKTSINYAFVHFHSDFSKGSTGFEIMFESERDEEDLTSLRSIAAILGGVSFGIFIFILLCSIVYKRYVGSADRRNTCPSSGNPDNDYLDAVQAAAPPSYQAVMADPGNYPRTPEVTPAASPAVTPIMPTRTLIRPLPLHNDGTPHLESLEEDEWNGLETPPPPYPGNVAPSFDDGILIRDLPPPPTYEMVSDNEELEEAVPTWAPVDVSDEPVDPVATEGQGGSPNNSETASTQLTSCDSDHCSSNALVGHGSPPAGDGASRCDRIPHRDEVLCVRCIEESAPEVRIRRQRSDGNIAENFLLLRDDNHQRPSHCRHMQPLRRRKTSGGYDTRVSENADASSDKRRDKRLQTRKERCRSVPALAQRNEGTAQRRRNVLAGHSPLTFRSLFSRGNHNHNSNRISPRSSNSNIQDSVVAAQPRSDVAAEESASTHELCRSSHI